MSFEITSDLYSVESALSDFILETSVAAGDDVHTVRLSVEHDLTVTASGAPADVCEFAVAACGDRAVERFIAAEWG